jgi:hypothetical protein
MDAMIAGSLMLLIASVAALALEWRRLSPAQRRLP